jgi:hypothetical protein
VGVPPEKHAITLGNPVELSYLGKSQDFSDKSQLVTDGLMKITT